MTEIWKEITGYQGFYEVSNFGRVRSVDRLVTRRDGKTRFLKGRIKSQAINSDGYYTVKLQKDGLDRRVQVHILVAKAFIPGFFSGAEVNHIDLNRKNNRSDNLQWVTHLENIQYSISCGTHVSVSKDYSGSNNPNYGNTKLAARYQMNPLLAKEKQSRPGEQNGRARKVSILFDDGTELQFPYISKCAEYLIANGLSDGKVSSVSTNISKAANSGAKYRGFHFSF